MNKKTSNILGVIIFIGIVMHFYIGYFHWDLIHGDTDILYSVSGYFLMDVVGLVLFILCEHFKIFFIKGLGTAMMALSTYYIYMEFNDPYNWKLGDYKDLATLLMSLINLFFIWHFTDIFKKIHHE